MTSLPAGHLGNPDEQHHEVRFAQNAWVPTDYSGRQKAFIFRMELYADLFEGVTPWAGEVPKGYLVDFAGALTDAEFRAMLGG